MGKPSRRRKGEKRAKQATPQRDGLHGFDLGLRQRAMVVPDIEFNQALIEAKVFACAYGFERTDGFPDLIPLLTLVGEHTDPLQRAFACFQRWGCEADGDVVDIQLMLKIDGTYLMWVGPEVERMMHRSTPHHQLIEPILLGISWTKRFDTTNPILRDLAQYCRSKLRPVAISAATANLYQEMPAPNTIKQIEALPRLIKYNLLIHEETKEPEHPMLRVERDSGRRKRFDPPEQRAITPRDCARLRRKTIDIAFPVTRERARRCGLIGAVRALANMPELSESQIIQAGINIILSRELASGKAHYEGIRALLPEGVWRHIYDRIERADGKYDGTALDPNSVLKQLQLDVTETLKQAGVQTQSIKFRQLQAIFCRKGYVDERPD